MSELKLKQYQKGYRYNSDTLFLYDFLSKLVKKGRVLDVGCGCGILALLVKKEYPRCEVDMVDLQEENVRLSLENALQNGLDVSVKQGDFLEFSEEKRYDFIISNPPFYSDGVQKSQDEHLSISRYSSYLPFEGFVQKSYKILNPKGRICFCYDAQQLHVIMYHLVKNRFGVEYLRFVHSKKEKISSLVLVAAKKNFKGMCKVLPPLVASDDDGYTKEAKDIFEKTNTMSYAWED